MAVKFITIVHPLKRISLIYCDDPARACSIFEVVKRGVAKAKTIRPKATEIR